MLHGILFFYIGMFGYASFLFQREKLGNVGIWIYWILITFGNLVSKTVFRDKK